MTGVDPLVVCEYFRTAVNAIRTGPDGFPCDPSQELKIRVLAGIAHGIAVDVFPDPQTPDERAWRRAADATTAWLESTARGVRDPAIAEEWFAARAGMPEMRPPGGA